MERNKIKEKELEFLAKEYKKNPELFKQESFIDSLEFLEKFGIFIKDKKNFPNGYLKLWPQDFVVEEITKDRELQTVEIDDFLDKKRDFSEEKSTIYATLVKCGLSTIEAIQELTNFLKGEKTRIQFAGIKDKDAITSQLISIRELDINKFQKFNSPYLFLKNAYSGKGIVETGNLIGNKFTILIRTDSFFQKEKILDKLKTIGKEGFYNFFYLQRFGTPRLINFYWGMFILKGEYEKAILSFLCSPGKRENAYFRNLREEIKENFGNWEKIEKITEPFPLILQNERKVISYLKENPEDFIGALNQIPEQVKLWVFAFTSFLFNEKLSFYIKKGIEPPKALPLILSNDKKDWLVYKKFLEKNRISPFSLKNLNPFPFIQRRKRIIQTKGNIIIEKREIVPEGVALSFILPKASYATTFLAHLFNLVSGYPPKDISNKSIDTKEILGTGSFKPLIKRFKEITYPKGENIFEK